MLNQDRVGFIGIKELSNYLSISQFTLRRWAETEAFPSPAIRVGARRERKWLRVDIEAWLIKSATKNKEAGK